MSEFTYLFRGRDMSASPEQMQRTMQTWLAWFKDLNAQGYIKDPGHPLEATGKVVTGKQKIVTDGPYAEAKDVVGGYIIVEARDLAHATEIANGFRFWKSAARWKCAPSRGSEQINGAQRSSVPARGGAHGRCAHTDLRAPVVTLILS